ncbi:MAG: FecR domain-containing protein [Spirochaetales bacterium]|nr:FecR domain-containing protein [Spirochaetales bacterium]
MKTINCCLLIIILIFFCGISAFAQAPLLAYYENVSGGLKVRYANGSELYADRLNFGDEIPIGSTIITEDGDFVEIELKNGSIIRINENTNFTIAAIQGYNGADENVFEMYVGKFRAIAAKTTGEERYRIRTRTAVCGIRGTDTGIEALYDETVGGNIGAKVFVFDGEVEVTKIDAITQKELGKITLKSGQWANTAAVQFIPTYMAPAEKKEFMRGLQFKELDPTKVPGHTVSSMGTETVILPGDTGDIDRGASQEEPEWFKNLREILGMEIGTVTIGDVTYAKAVLQPTLKIDDFRLVLYLPLIYQSNMFDPDDWYQPDGNNEWSFGFDAKYEDDLGGRIGDIFADLILKIKSLEYGELRDDFFLKLGNLNNITIGHGLIMRDYANDADFPSVRRLGFNVGADFDAVGFELMSNDLALACRGTPEILGARFYVRPAGKSFPLAFGLTGVVDFNPANALEGYTGPTETGDPMFFNFGLDMEFPLMEEEAFGLVLFADLGCMLPYFREAVPGGIEPGFAFDAIMHGPSGEETLSNYGIAAGLLGNVAEFDWRLEARYYTGVFKPAFYNTLYDRQRGMYVYEVVDYLLNPGDPENQISTFGIYGEGTYTMDKVFSFTAGYLLPLDFVDDGVEIADDDYFVLKFALEPGVIPVVGIYFQIIYERTRFVNTIVEGEENDLTLFDANTVLKTAVGYPLTENIHLIFYFTTALKKDTDTGEIIYDGNGRPEVATTISFETQISF